MTPPARPEPSASGSLSAQALLPHALYSGPTLGIGQAPPGRGSLIGCGRSVGCRGGRVVWSAASGVAAAGGHSVETWGAVLSRRLRRQIPEKRRETTRRICTKGERTTYRLPPRKRGGIGFAGDERERPQKKGGETNERGERMSLRAPLCVFFSSFPLAAFHLSRRQKHPSHLPRRQATSSSLFSSLDSSCRFPPMWPFSLVAAE